MKNFISRPLPFILASTYTGTMIVNHQDKNTFFPGGTPYGVGYQYLSTSGFDPDEISNAISLLHLRHKYYGDNVVALDCGANIGAHSIAWGIEMTNWGKVISFEAQERVYYALAGNIAINNCFNVSARHCALGNPKTSDATLDIPTVDYTIPSSFGSLELKNNANNEFIGQAINYQDSITVPLISLDSLNLDRIDFIKIDVEGMEMEVLDGTINNINKHHPILLVEYIKTGDDKIINFLEPMGYQCFKLGINILAIHKDDPSIKEIHVN